ncbi:MAG: hypothetical protein AAFY15_08125 [Cyanobacteria bacterium J06648_11]
MDLVFAAAMLPLLPSQCESQPVRSCVASPPPEPSRPRPILSLTADDQTLFVELVQIAASSGDREMAWVRPMLLVHRDREAKVPVKVGAIVQESDLLWPLVCFEETYAEDFMPFLALAVDLDPANAKLVLRAFIRRAWELHWPAQAA